MISDVSIGNIANLDDDERDSINIVLKGYGDKEPYELVEQTHHEQPWLQARNGLPEGEKCSNEITLESMGAYYGSL